MNKFAAAGEKERYLATWFFSQVGVGDATFTDAWGCGRHDVVFGEGGFLGEIKVRSERADAPVFRLKPSDFDIGSDPAAFFDMSEQLQANPRFGYLIEKDKWDYLIETAKQNDQKPLYINFFTGGRVLVFLLDAEPRWQTIGCPRQTCGDRTTVGKVCGLLEDPFWQTTLKPAFKP